MNPILNQLTFSPSKKIRQCYEPKYGERGTHWQRDEFDDSDYYTDDEEDNEYGDADRDHYGFGDTEQSDSESDFEDVEEVADEDVEQSENESGYETDNESNYDSESASEEVYSSDSELDSGQFDHKEPVTRAPPSPDSPSVVNHCEFWPASLRNVLHMQQPIHAMAYHGYPFLPVFNVNEQPWLCELNKDCQEYKNLMKNHENEKNSNFIGPTRTSGSMNELYDAINAGIETNFEKLIHLALKLCHYLRSNLKIPTSPVIVTVNSSAIIVFVKLPSENGNDVKFFKFVLADGKGKRLEAGGIVTAMKISGLKAFKSGIRKEEIDEKTKEKNYEIPKDWLDLSTKKLVNILDNVKELETAAIFIRYDAVTRDHYGLGQLFPGWQSDSVPINAS